MPKYPARLLSAQRQEIGRLRRRVGVALIVAGLIGGAIVAIPLAYGQDQSADRADQPEAVEVGDETSTDPLIDVVSPLSSSERVRLDQNAREDQLVDDILLDHGMTEMRSSAQTAEDRPAVVEGYRVSYSLSTRYQGAADFARVGTDGESLSDSALITTVNIEEMTILDVLFDVDRNVIAVVPGEYTRWSEPKAGDTVRLGNGAVYVFTDNNYLYDAESGTIEFLDESLFPESTGE